MSPGMSVDVEPSALIAFANTMAPEAMARLQGTAELGTVTLPDDAFGKVRRSRGALTQFSYTLEAIVQAAEEGWRAVGLLSEGTAEAAQGYQTTDALAASGLGRLLNAGINPLATGLDPLTSSPDPLAGSLDPAWLTGELDQSWPTDEADQSWLTTPLSVEADQ